jgi:hypothetical protein
VRYWTVSEARAYLPRVRELAECIQYAAKLRAGQAGSTNGNRAPILDAQEALEELQAGDIVFRDAMTGLLDFHAKGADGVVYFLCWRLEDEDLAWWHSPEDGFPGRQPLPRDPE